MISGSQDQRVLTRMTMPEGSLSKNVPSISLWLLPYNSSENLKKAICLLQTYVAGEEI